MKLGFNAEGPRFVREHLATTHDVDDILSMATVEIVDPPSLEGCEQGMTCYVRSQVASCDVWSQVALCGCKPTLVVSCDVCACGAF